MATSVAQTAVGQSMCVIQEKEITKLSGVVKQPDGQAIPNALVAARDRDDDEKLVAKIRTDDSGRFEFSKIDAGRYNVSVSYPTFIELVFPVHLIKERSHSKGLAITLGWDYNDPCGGGEVSVR